MVWDPKTSRGQETSKTRYRLQPYLHGKGADLGCGFDKISPQALGVDKIAVPGVDFVCNVTSLNFFEDEFFDFVYSSHTLEDIEDTRAALIEWWRILKPQGFLILYLPDKNLYPNIGQPGANIAHKHDFIPSDIIHILQTIGGFSVEQQKLYGGSNEYSFLLVVRKISTFREE